MCSKEMDALTRDRLLRSFSFIYLAGLLPSLVIQSNTNLDIACRYFLEVLKAHSQLKVDILEELSKVGKLSIFCKWRNCTRCLGGSLRAVKQDKLR